MLNRIKEIIFNNPKVVPIGIAAALILSAVLTHFVHKPPPLKPYINPTNIQENAAMITNRAMTSGGTGIVMLSENQGSFVLTNDHVCQLVKNGGVVVSNKTNYQVVSYLESAVNDLCLIYVSDNLHQETDVAVKAPELFSHAVVSGHPALMPTVISEGEFSDKKIIDVVMGFKPCSEEDLNNPSTGLMCLFAGGLPLIKSYEAELVSATIMPGSSGSGVYNTQNQLVGVVFAGSGEFGYAWIMPYQALVNFLYVEVPKTQFKLVNQEVNILQEQDQAHKIKSMKKKCITTVDSKYDYICNIVKNSVIWVK